MENSNLEKIRQKLIRDLEGEVLSALEDPTIIEIMLNPDGNLWAEKLGGKMAIVGTMSSSRAESMIYTLATYLDSVIDTQNPTLEGELPIQQARIACAIPPVVNAPIFSIRKRAIKVFTLKEYVDQGILNDGQYKILQESVLTRKNILIVGGTASGKTTFANALINEISLLTPHHRILIIEDTSEIQCTAKNAVTFRATEFAGMAHITRHIMRHRPDRIIIGEVRGGEALTLLRSWISGHAGGICTVHGDSSKSALLRMEQLIGDATEKPHQMLIGEAIDLIVHIKKTNQGRRIDEILSIHNWDGTEYNSTKIDDGDHRSIES